MAESLPTIETAARALERLRATRPLVQNITNFVAMASSANILLALGASPAMVHTAEEAGDFARISDALVVNIGTLSPPWVEGMQAAITSAALNRKPWVLDPVGVGATPYRTAVALELAEFAPAVIRGNASEILALEGAKAEATRGVDATDSSAVAVEAAKRLAVTTGAVVAVTGATDYVTDGRQVLAVEGGHPLMPLATALGCALSAVVAAFTTVAPPLEAAVAGLAVFGAAGAEAGARVKGPGHLTAEICDALHAMTPETLARRAHVLVETVG